MPKSVFIRPERRGFCQFGASRAGLLLLEQALASSLGQHVALKVEVLIESGDVSISNAYVRMVIHTGFTEQ